MGYDIVEKGVGVYHWLQKFFLADHPPRGSGVACRRSHLRGRIYCPRKYSQEGSLRHPNKILEERPHALAIPILRGNTRKKGLGEKIARRTWHKLKK